MAEEIKMKCMVGGKLSVVSLSTARYSPYPLRATKVYHILKKHIPI